MKFFPEKVDSAMDFLLPLPIITNMINIENNHFCCCLTTLSHFLSFGCDVILFGTS